MQINIKHVLFPGLFAAIWGDLGKSKMEETLNLIILPQKRFKEMVIVNFLNICAINCQSYIIIKQFLPKN